MRTCRRRPATVTAVAAAVLGTVTLTACDAAVHQAPGPRSASASGKPAPKPTVRWDTTPRSVAAVGDSITRGFDACSALADCPKVSWSTGSDGDVHSLAVRLLGKQAARHSWNDAVTGARVADLPGQLRKAAKHRPELVTVMIGANDACRDSTSQMTSVADFRADFEKSLDTLRETLPKTQVYVASVPNLKRLWSQGRTSPLGKQIWKLGGICPSMLADADAKNSAANRRRDKVQSRVVAYNKVLKDVCNADALCRFDENAVFNYRFSTVQLSHWDWFHPSRDGQAKLAEIAYRRVTAARAVS